MDDNSVCGIHINQNEESVVEFLRVCVILLWMVRTLSTITQVLMTALCLSI
jgi:hypothetical protein